MDDRRLHSFRGLRALASVRKRGNPRTGSCRRHRARGPDLIGNHTFVEVATGRFHTGGRTADGTAFCWGLNNRGQIGDGTLVSRSAPTAVSGALGFAELAPGAYTTCGRTLANVGYCWGDNGQGAIGDGTLVDPRPTPTAVAGGHAFIALTSSGGNACGQTISNDVYCWASTGTASSATAPSNFGGARRG